MPDQCQGLALLAGLVAMIYNQAHHALQLPRRFRTGYMRGAIWLTANQALDLETLRRCNQHHEPGSALVFNL